MYNPLCCASSTAVAASVTSDDLEPQPQPSDILVTAEIGHTPSPAPPPLPKSPHSPSNRFANMRSLSLSNPAGGGNVQRGGQMSRSLTSAGYGCRSGRIAPTLSLRDRRDSMSTLGIDASGGMGAENSLSGILYKWVNYGTGWRGRWFVLKDGVLSFYKLHGPDKIVVRSEEDVGGKLIGQKSFSRMCSRRGSSGSSRPHRSMPSGEIHLEISTIQASKSDEKRFSIFTGTRTIHLRAETREDRESWLQALHETKDMFPRDSNDDSLQIQVDDLSVSTEKLKQKLLEEGMEEAAIIDCEQIMRNEFSTIHDRFMLLRQKEFNLIETLWRLEAEKVDLENAIINDDQCEIRRRLSLARGHTRSHEGISSDPDDNNHNDPDDSENEDDGFFETQEILSPCSLSSKSDFQGSSFGSDEDEDPETNNKSHLSKQEHATVQRRKKLPDPLEKEKAVSLWSMIKDNIGKDLTKVCLPVYFNEPISSLQKSCEDLEYSYLIDRAYENGKSGNYLMRMLNVAAFAVSGYASTDGRTCKPFNPLLGETYEAEYPEKGIRFVSEKVSHHPMVIACHCEGRGWKFWGDCNLKNRFRGRSIQLDPVGTLTLEFDDGELYQWTKVTTSIYNLIIGKLYCDHSGTMNIKGNSKYSCKIKFKEQSFIDRTPHQVQGVVHDESGKVVAKLFGKWNESLHFTEEAFSGQDSKGSEARLLWKRSKPLEPQNRYNLTRFAVTLNELTPGLKEKLPPTDSRLRPDQRHLEKGEYEMAYSEKLRLEEKQRQARKVQEKGWKPKWFAKDDNSETYKYIGGYWEARKQGNWEHCLDIFGSNNSTHGD